MQCNRRRYDFCRGGLEVFDSTLREVYVSSGRGNANFDKLKNC